MDKRYVIDFNMIDFSMENKKEYIAVFMTEEIYGKLFMGAFYVPRSSVVKIIEKKKSEVKIDKSLRAYREISCHIIYLGKVKQINSFTVEEVTHPSKLEEIVRAFLTYTNAPSG